MQVDILAISAHPDDVELCCAGTLMRHIDLGYTVGLVELTRGELGTRGNADIRAAEAEQARQILGAAFRQNLALPDGFFAYGEAALHKVISVVRNCQPAIVLTNAPRDRHPDHGRAARLVADACYYAGLAKIETSGPDQKPQQRHRPNAVYHFIQDYNLEPDLLVDITDYIDRKMQSIAAFRSQFPVGAVEYEDAPQTPLTVPNFMEYMRAKAATYGRTAGYDYAEGFIVARTPGVKDLMELE